uniref:Nucleoprotein n=1 Tax=Mecsek Mountains virus TaxID=3036599 RepID=A0A9Y1ZDR2_9VIRU|nr:nucleoprotein [Mecsek Mountains virus]
MSLSHLKDNLRQLREINRHLEMSDSSVTSYSGSPSKTKPNGADVKSFFWLQTLRRELSPYTTDIKTPVIQDAQTLIQTLDFSEVVNVQRLMRKEKRNDQDLERLRNLNKVVDNAVVMKSKQQQSVLKVGRLTKEELVLLSSDLERLKNKVTRSEGQSAGVYQGNLSSTQLDQRSKLLQSIGMTNGKQRSNVVRVWDVTNPKLLINQFGTIPSLTMACIAKQGKFELNDVVTSLSALGLVYTAKYPNLEDLSKLEDEYPCLSSITVEESAVNISGYNLSLSAAVKAGATLLGGGNMIETIKVTPNNIADILKSILVAKQKVGMFVDENPGQRNPYENVLYKVCLSGEGWPYVSSRSQIVGRAWDNTIVDLAEPKNQQDGVVRPKEKEKEKEKDRKTNSNQYSVGLSFSQTHTLQELMKTIDPSQETWMDIEGRYNDPVEICIFQPKDGNYIHFYREPTDKKTFINDSKYSHGMDISDLFNTTPGLTSAVLAALPKNMAIRCQGSEDISKLLTSQARSDIKLIDVRMTKEQARKFEDDIWDVYFLKCKMHTGLVREKSKNGKQSKSPHCALFDCLMYYSATKDKPYDHVIRNILPHDMIFREASTTLVL